jgi:hypothetical protein
MERFFFRVSSSLLRFSSCVIVGVPVRWVHKTKDEVAEAYANCPFSRLRSSFRGKWIVTRYLGLARHTSVSPRLHLSIQQARRKGARYGK